MHIEPVLPAFEYVRIRRTGGILGVDQALEVGSNLQANVTCRHSGDRSFALDAVASQELMGALSKLATSGATASPRTGADLFNYDVELAFDGTTYHFNSVDLGAHEALVGVMMAANRLIDQDPDPAHIMQMHVGAPA
jgi:hypothetical protein